VRVPATPHDLTVDLEIVESEPPMGMVLTDDLTIRLASPLFEKGCIATWGFCATDVL
jgi:hypothetical protein